MLEHLQRLSLQIRLTVWFGQFCVLYPTVPQYLIESLICEARPRLLDRTQKLNRHVGKFAFQLSVTLPAKCSSTSCGDAL